MNQSLKAIDILAKRFGSADWNDYTFDRTLFYDTVRLPLDPAAANANEINFFAVPLGVQDPVSGNAKSLEQTNMTQVRQFGQKFFLIHTMKIIANFVILPRQTEWNTSTTPYITSTASNAMSVLLDFFNEGVFQMKIGSKEYQVVPQPFKHMPAGFGISEFSYPESMNDDLAGSLTSGVFVAESNAQEDIYNVIPEQLIEAEQTLEPKIVFPAGRSADFQNIGYNVANNAFDLDVDVEVMFILDGVVIRPVQ